MWLIAEAFRAGVAENGLNATLAEAIQQIELKDRLLRSVQPPKDEDQMATVSLKEAQDKLPELIHHLGPGDELVITENGQPVARLVPTSVEQSERKLGTMHGTVLHMAPDFDAPLDEFREYMQ
jgi:antitoxin (DNA-binding transcriptional repressor) of toxin-antitoxin stability system